MKEAGRGRTNLREKRQPNVNGKKTDRLEIGTQLCVDTEMGFWVRMMARANGRSIQEEIVWGLRQYRKLEEAQASQAESGEIRGRVLSSTTPSGPISSNQVFPERKRA